MKLDNPILEQHFPFEEALSQELVNCTLKLFDKGEVIVKQHSYIRALPLLVEGSLRVYKQTEDREILCYYIQNGGTCGLSLGACLEGKQVESEMVAIQPSEVLFVPSFQVQEWQRKYPSWNRYLFHTFTIRQQQLLDTFGEIAFSKMEKRIKDYLLTLLKEKKCLHGVHHSSRIGK